MSSFFSLAAVDALVELADVLVVLHDRHADRLHFVLGGVVAASGGGTGRRRAVVGRDRRHGRTADERRRTRRVVVPGRSRRHHLHAWGVHPARAHTGHLRATELELHRRRHARVLRRECHAAVEDLFTVELRDRTGQTGVGRDFRPKPSLGHGRAASDEREREHENRGKTGHFAFSCQGELLKKTDKTASKATDVYTRK